LGAAAPRPATLLLACCSTHGAPGRGVASSGSGSRPEPRLARPSSIAIPSRRRLGPDRDEQVWEYAAANGLVIVSKDSAVRQRNFLLGHPPKIIWIRRGNCSMSRSRTSSAPASVS